MFEGLGIRKLSTSNASHVNGLLDSREQSHGNAAGVQLDASSGERQVVRMRLRTHANLTRGNQRVPLAPCLRDVMRILRSAS